MELSTYVCSNSGSKIKLSLTNQKVMELNGMGENLLKRSCLALPFDQETELENY